MLRQRYPLCISECECERGRKREGERPSWEALKRRISLEARPYDKSLLGGLPTLPTFSSGNFNHQVDESSATVWVCVSVGHLVIKRAQETWLQTQFCHSLWVILDNLP